MPMSLLPLQIVLGFQVAAAIVILIQLMKDDESERPISAEKLRRAAPRQNTLHPSFKDDAR
jgi:hypothetical protein